MLNKQQLTIWQLNQIDCLIETCTTYTRRQKIKRVYVRMLAIFETGQDSVSRPNWTQLVTYRKEME